MGNAQTTHFKRNAWVVAFGICMLLACGDDESSPSSSGPVTAGESCAAPGGVDVGCECSADQKLGSRKCQADRTWTECRCPPGLPGNCTPGQTVLCMPCPGSTEPWESTCLQGGTTNCTCASDAGTGFGGTGGAAPDAGDSGPLDTDAGDDSDGG